MASTYLNRSTPGVYITEIDAFGSSIVGVATAVPVFIGYTQFAGDPKTGTPLYGQAVAITSMTDYINFFGGAAPQTFTVTKLTPPPTQTPGQSGTQSSTTTPSFVANYTTPSSGSSAAPGGNGFTTTMTGFSLQSTASVTEPNQFNLYWQMRLFFANGGGNCYIVSVGSYWTGMTPTTLPSPLPDPINLGHIAVDDLANGIVAAGLAVGPTMIVVPEACQLNDQDYGTIIGDMLGQAATLQDRVAILDLPSCMGAATYADLQGLQTRFSNALAPYIANASYGAAYAPVLNTSVVSPNDILYTNLVGNEAENEVINNILTTQANMMYSSPQLDTIQTAIATAFPITASATNTPQYSGSTSTTATATTPAVPYPGPTTTLQQWQSTLDNLLLNTLPVFQQIEQQIANSMNVAPPSGIMAGVWTKSDAQSGVWNAPANIALASVVSPAYNMTDIQQASFNVPTNGEAIDVIRAQPSRGTVVWGARTLDGNSNDYRYIQVRRTLIYVEQSIKVALQSYVFAANDATTWSTVTASISSFLTGLWQQGGLMGAKASDAFTVTCGLGSTMTSQDVLGGYMVVAVTLQMIHPAEFIELTFTQTMGS